MTYKYSHSKAPQQSNEVEQFQKRLNYIRQKFKGDWRYLTPDGLYGRGTRDAVRKFQEYVRLFQGFDNVVVNGQLDDVTQSAVNKMYQNALHNTPPTPKPGQKPTAPFKPLHQTRYAAYSGVQTNGPPPKISYNQPVVGKSSILNQVVDSEWKSLGKDILDITGAVADRIVELRIDPNNIERIKNALAKELIANDANLQRLIMRKTNTFNALHRSRNVAESLIRKAGDGTEYLVDGIKGVTNSPQLNTYADCMAKSKQNVDKARQMFVDLATSDMKKAAEARAVTTAMETTAKEASDSASKWGKVAKGAKIASWAINVGTALYYSVNMATAETDEEFNENATKLKDSIGTTAVDIGLSFGGAAATRLAVGAVGGPAGIVVATLFTVVDLVSLCVTGESISTKIWNFIKQLNWGEAFKGYQTLKREQHGIMWM